MLAATRESQTISEAMNDDKWHQAMKEDYDALMDNKTWHLVPPSANKSLIECKCVYRIKEHPDGTLINIRLV
jgi:hypothetical protein